jgi:uncharacterized glyoxalase superfamily protein PhnB
MYKSLRYRNNHKWYVDFLAFQCTYKSSIKNPDYALLENCGTKIYLAKSNNRESYASNMVVIEVSDIKKEFKALEDSGAIFIQTIEKGVFSDKEFVIKDYEDNKLVYVQKT